MFNCLPGAMLQKGHTHQCQKGFSCSRVPSQHNARTTASYRLFNPGRPGGRATTRRGPPTAGKLSTPMRPSRAPRTGPEESASFGRWRLRAVASAW